MIQRLILVPSTPSKKNIYIFLTNSINGTVNVVSNDPPATEWNDQFTTVPFRSRKIFFYLEFCVLHFLSLLRIPAID